MARRPDIIQDSNINLRVPIDLRARLDLSLYSELESRVPHGAYTRFFTERLREFFSWQTLPLEPLGFPPGFFVRGPAQVIESLRQTLEHIQLEAHK